MLNYQRVSQWISHDISMDHGKFLLQGPEEDLHGCTCSCPVITKARCFLWPEHHSKARPFPELWDGLWRSRLWQSKSTGIPWGNWKLIQFQWPVLRSLDFLGIIRGRDGRGLDSRPKFSIFPCSVPLCLQGPLLLACLRRAAKPTWRHGLSCWLMPTEEGNRSSNAELNRYSMIQYDTVKEF